MAANAYFQPKFQLNHMGTKLVNMTSDTFEIGLIASGTLAARSTTESYEFVSDLLANGGSPLTEVSTSGTGYTGRLALTSTSWTVSGLTATFSAASPSWTSATFSTVYAWIHDETAGATAGGGTATDSVRPLLAIFDFGGAQSVSGATFTLTVNSSGLVSWTANP